MNRYSKIINQVWIPAICCIVILGIGYFLSGNIWNFSFEDEVNDLEIRGNNYTVFVKKGGAMTLKVGKDTYAIESSFSYPAKSPQYNRFELNESGTNQKMNMEHAVQVRAIGRDQIEILGDFKDYSVTRLVKLSDGKITISERFRNKRNSPTGILIGHTLGGISLFSEIYLGGDRRSGTLNKIKRFVGRKKEITWLSENPTIYVKGTNSGLGIAIQDSVFRLKLVMNTSLFGNKVIFGMRNFALDSQGDRTFEWALYVLTRDDDYFSFINKLRMEMKTNFSIQGPFDYFDVILNEELIAKPGKMKAYLSRKRLKIIALTPWLDYTNFNFNTGTVLSRDEYKSIMRRAINAIKYIDKSINVIGCMEGNLVSLPAETVKALSDILPEWKKKQGIYLSSGAETEIIRKSSIRWKDSLILRQHGGHVFEIYYQMRDETSGNLGNPPLMMAVAVYAAPGNSAFKYWLDQARFMLEDTGFDGLYIDQFSMAFNDLQRFSFEKWDGVTADINKNGQIIRKYTDGSFVGIEARKKLIAYVLNKGKIIVANTHAAAKEVQSAPIYRFLEGGRGYNPLSLGEGTIPPYYSYLAKGHLGSPISLGERYWFWGDKTKNDYARFVMKNIIMYLRHGLLYYCFNTEIPESGLGAGEFEPINHMFPITPGRLGEGFIEGQERVITAVSGEFIWRQARKPSVLLFDVKGHGKRPDARIERSYDGWKINIKLRDWEEIAVVE